ncbi:MAG: hypothetical protein L0Y72_06640 [Gemmataceae bacterium]|nr:hypothetical protein [Gemmataceae bacterium]
MFRNREDEARQLAALLKGRALHDPLVLAIPRRRAGRFPGSVGGNRPLV